MKYYGMTDRGRIRQSNQDSYVIATNEANDIFAIVADGVGGNNGGDVASRLAVGYFSHVFSENKGFSSVDETRDWLKKEVTNCNRSIYTYSLEHPKVAGMGTTFCGVMVTPLACFVVNVGDSRAYGWYPDGRMRLLTRDHTLVNDMLLHGEISLEEAKNSTQKNVLTNAMGIWQNVRADIDVHQEDLSGFLLCSDGLHGYVDDKVISGIIFNTETDPALKVRKLIKASLDAGGYDNVTAILIDLGERNV